MEERPLPEMIENLRKCVRDFAEQIQLLRNEMAELTARLAEVQQESVRSKLSALNEERRRG